MDEIVFPIIRPKDYDAFWRLTNGDIPDTYDEWLDVNAKSRLDRKMQGAVIIDIHVYPDDFARFCKAENVTPDAKSLGEFAVEEVIRQRR